MAREKAAQLGSTVVEAAKDGKQYIEASQPARVAPLCRVLRCCMRLLRHQCRNWLNAGLQIVAHCAAGEGQPGPAAQKEIPWVRLCNLIASKCVKPCAWHKRWLRLWML